MGDMSGLDWWLWRWRSLELRWRRLLLLVVMVLLMVHPWRGAIMVVREAVTSWWHRVNEGLSCLVGAGTLWTAEAHHREGLSMALGVLVREGGMGGVGGAEHATEGGGLGTGQGAHGGDRGGRTVLMKGPLEVT